MLLKQTVSDIHSPYLYFSFLTLLTFICLHLPLFQFIYLYLTLFAFIFIFPVCSIYCSVNGFSLVCQIISDIDLWYWSVIGRWVVTWSDLWPLRTKHVLQETNQNNSLTLKINTENVNVPEISLLSLSLSFELAK